MNQLKKNNLSFELVVTLTTIIWFGVIYLLSQLIVCFWGLMGCFELFRFANWDGQHFIEIAEKGYVSSYQFAFFPLYPLLIKLVSLLLPWPLWIIGMIINLICTIGGGILLGRIIHQLKPISFWWLFLLIISFPVSFFFITIYSEALFFFLSVLAIYYYQKNNHWLAIVFLALLTLTRMAGIALVFAILVDQYLQKKSLQKYLLPFLGIGLFAWYGYLKTGVVLSIVFAETYWERIITIPGFAIYNSLTILLREGVSYREYSLVLDLVLVVGVLILLFKSYLLLPRLYFFYALFSLLIPLSTSTFLSLPRFLVVIFPLFIAFYLWSNRVVRIIYCVIGVILSVVFLSNFLQGGWVS